MANPEHLEILKQGVEVWNRWRRVSPQIRPDLIEADLSGADLIRANLSGSDVIRADLRRAYLRWAHLGQANLHRTNLHGAVLTKSVLAGADLSGADLGRAGFIGANFSNADLSGASLVGADLSRAYLGGVYLVRADLGGADLSRAQIGGTIFTDNDLSEVKGLETVAHRGPSSIGIDTVYKSGGRIPEVFLRGCGVPEEFITYMRSLVAQPIQFYSCFISFTEADDPFSERLYNDLQGAGVRCWRWKEDAAWGKTLMRSIDEAVRVYDKLIVVCSEQSLQAPAVIREIERALQKEDDLARQGRDAEVLFPIRLDDYILSGWGHHRKADVTAKNVGDFRGWKSHDDYQKAFDRLLRDLKAGA